MKIRDYMMMATGVVCALATAQVFAQTEDDADEADDSGVAAELAGLVLVAEQDEGKEEKGFDLLVRTMLVRGVAEVSNPDVGTFAPMTKNKAYPLGSVFRTGGDGAAVVVFSATESVQMFENTEIVVMADKDNPKARCVQLVSGRVKTFLKDNLLEGLFSVVTPHAVCENMAGRADLSLAMDGENEVFQIATITGAIRVKGPQYTIEALRAANTVNVLTSPGCALSHLTSVKGDFKITLDNGMEEPVVYEMSPKAVVKIWREAAPVGGRMVVAALVVSPTGTARHRFAYAVGRAELVTGEQADLSAEQDQELQELLKAAEGLKPATAGKAPAAKADDGAPDEEEDI